MELKSKSFTPKHPEIKTIEKNIDLVKRGIFEDIKQVKKKYSSKRE